MQFLIFCGLGNQIIKIVFLLSKIIDPYESLSSFPMIHVYGLVFMNFLHLLKLSGSSVYFLVLDRIFSDLAHALRISHRASLVAQWLGIRLPMQGTWVRALVLEDPTCRGATKPVRHNY